jgi:eukaryotic-like serine/threonine-protein kinase
MSASADEFLRNLLRSELLSREELQAAIRKVPSERRENPAHIADDLVAARLLTQFQAHKVLAGVVVGLKLGPYQVQAPIGRGGMGTVYLARDSRNGEAAAIKVVSPKRAKGGERHLARFQREMMLSQKLKHPSVALTRDVGVFKGVHYLVLEYIPGLTLYRLVMRDGPLSVPRTARLFVEICSALDHAHSQGLIHRDLKPSNIMVTPDDHAKLLDLGLALMIGEEVDDPEVVGGKGYVVGSVEYIAPEQTRDPTQVDARADLYSLGCTLYFALTGRGPFTGPGPPGSPNALSPKELMRAHRHADPEPIQSRNPTVPAGLANLIQRLLAKKPKYRPASAAIVRQELLAFSEPGAGATGSSVSVELVDPFALVDDETVPDTLSEVFRLGSGPELDVEPVSVEQVSVEPVDAEPVEAEFSLVGPASRRSFRSRKKNDSVQVAVWSVLGLVGLAAIGVIIFVMVNMAKR